MSCCRDEALLVAVDSCDATGAVDMEDVEVDDRLSAPLIVTSALFVIGISSQRSMHHRMLLSTAAVTPYLDGAAPMSKRIIKSHQIRRVSCSVALLQMHQMLTLHAHQKCSCMMLHLP